MATDDVLIHDIMNAEGFSLDAYKDTRGFWTIGYGHLLPDQNKDWTGHTITEEEADELLVEDINKAYQFCTLLPEWPALDTECRRNAVFELVFNIGNKWRGFIKARYDIQNKNWKGAHDELLDSLWAKEVGPARSTRLANYLLSGAYPVGK